MSNSAMVDQKGRLKSSRPSFRAQRVSAEFFITAKMAPRFAEQRAHEGWGG